ncbi:tyrosine-type recombinase/integrase [Nocardia fluminea]|uniref:tyrosine-type recombinase/integrase n=1 Tax=Nocardia fluminea TaxID=134984 RepID=UPI0031841873
MRSQQRPGSEIGIAGHTTDQFSNPRSGPRRLRLLLGSMLGRAVLDAASSAADLPDVVPHSLRPTAASLAISAGANIKVVQRMLGHKTATPTLDLYGHLFDEDLDPVAAALNVKARAVADELRTFEAG